MHIHYTGGCLTWPVKVSIPGRRIHLCKKNSRGSCLTRQDPLLFYGLNNVAIRSESHYAELRVCSQIHLLTQKRYVLLRFTFLYIFPILLCIFYYILGFLGFNLYSIVK